MMTETEAVVVVVDLTALIPIEEIGLEVDLETEEMTGEAEEVEDLIIIEEGLQNLSRRGQELYYRRGL